MSNTYTPRAVKDVENPRQIFTVEDIEALEDAKHKRFVFRIPVIEYRYATVRGKNFKAALAQALRKFGKQRTLTHPVQINSLWLAATKQELSAATKYGSWRNAAGIVQGTVERCQFPHGIVEIPQELTDPVSTPVADPSTTINL